MFRERAFAMEILLDEINYNNEKPPVFVLKTGGFGSSGETRLHFLPGGKKREVLPNCLNGATLGS